MAYHNLCESLVPPPGTAELLGLGLKYCIERPSAAADVKETVSRITRDVRLHEWLRSQDFAEDTGNYIPNLYLRSSFEPPKASTAVEVSLRELEHDLTQQSAALGSQDRHYNLSLAQSNTLQAVNQDHRYKVVDTDKNLGPAIMERLAYIQRVYDDHLKDASSYCCLSKATALQRIEETRSQLLELAERHLHLFSPAERTYFDRCRSEETRVPVFYLLMKIHKNPIESRPVVSCAGSFNELFSKWLDHKMEAMLPLTDFKLRDSYQVLDELRGRDNFQPGTKVFTSDAKGMYNNIEPEHGIEVMRRWIDEYGDELPKDFPRDFFLDVLTLVLKNNVFQSGDTFWLQTKGTAMGTSTACKYATLYFAYYERTHLWPKYSTYLGYYRRFIDDVFGAWNTRAPDSARMWREFRHDLNQFGLLRWKTTELKNSVDFLDLTLSLNSTHGIETKTYQKPMNLHLYIPPSSAHPPGLFRSLVLSTLQRYWRQCSNKDDYRDIATKFAMDLLARGYTIPMLHPLYQEAADRIDAEDINPRTPSTPPDTRNTLFAHLEFHPRGLERHAVRKAMAKHLGPQLPFDRYMVAYHRPTNLRDKLTKSSMEEEGEYQVSLLLPGLTKG